MMDRRELISVMAASLAFPVDAVKKLFSPPKLKISESKLGDPFTIPIFSPCEMRMARTLTEKACMGFIHAVEILAYSMNHTIDEGGDCVAKRLRAIGKQSPELYGFVSDEMDSMSPNGTIKRLRDTVPQGIASDGAAYFCYEQQIYTQGNNYLGGAMVLRIAEQKQGCGSVCHYHLDSPVERRLAIIHIRKIGRAHPKIQPAADVLFSAWEMWDIHRPFPTEGARLL